MKLTCTDQFGNTHNIEESEFIDRTSVYGVYIQHNTVLLTQNNTSKQWGLPGGGADEGEMEKYTHIRELREELGAIQVEVGDKIGSLDGLFWWNAPGRRPWKSHMQYYYVTELVFDFYQRTDKGEILVYDFFSLPLDLNSLNMDPAVAKLLNTLQYPHTS